MGNILQNGKVLPAAINVFAWTSIILTAWYCFTGIAMTARDYLKDLEER